MTNPHLSLELKKQWFINSHQDPIENYYDFEGEIGSGSYGKVFRAREKSLGRTVAVKIIQKNRVVEFDAFKHEVEILRFLDHPNIVKLLECFETERLCFLVLEFCEGGELLQMIAKEKNFSEVKAAMIMRKLISAVRYCHDNNICHRDLKPENCLIVDKSESSDIKIIDFGLATRIDEQHILTDICGTAFYIAPEVLSGHYDQECDCWSLGVILYMMLSGRPPFYGKNNQEVLVKVYNASYSFRSKAFAQVSEMAKDLISRLLVKDPGLRMTAKEAFEHPWIQVLSPLPECTLSSQIYDNIRQFVKFQKFKRATLMFIASRLSEREIFTLKEVFVGMDKEGNGSLSREEFEEGMKKHKAKLSSSDLENVWKVLDTNHNGKIDYIEFVTACISSQRYVTAGILKTAFEFYDIVSPTQEKDGFITASELLQVFSSGEVSMRQNELQQMIADVDLNGDGKIDYMEFIELMTNNSPS
jgi:calcium-dependent protein kinase